MVTIIIIVLLFMLLIAVIILLDINFDRKEYKIRIQDCASTLDNLKKENSYLLTNNDNLKIRIDSQDRRFNKLKICSDFRDSKITELENKYQSAHDEIFERDEIIKSLNYQINKYDKCNKQIAQDLKLKNNVIEDAWSVIRKLEKEKDKAINQSQSAIKLCNKMANKFKSLNSELKTIESKLLRKLSH